MDAKVFVHCQDFTLEELLQLLQGIRDAEQAHFREKEVGIWMETDPQMPAEELKALFARLNPPFDINLEVPGELDLLQ